MCCIFLFKLIHASLLSRRQRPSNEMIIIELHSKIRATHRGIIMYLIYLTLPTGWNECSLRSDSTIVYLIYLILPTGWNECSLRSDSIIVYLIYLTLPTGWNKCSFRSGSVMYILLSIRNSPFSIAKCIPSDIRRKSILSVLSL